MQDETIHCSHLKMLEENYGNSRRGLARKRGNIDFCLNEVLVEEGYKIDNLYRGDHNPTYSFITVQYDHEPPAHDGNSSTSSIASLKRRVKLSHRKAIKRVDMMQTAFMSAGK
ncbi:hypothetical protein MIZ01_2643 [Sideroxyarcus emersonii]|uniref:Uncharacterized protein n=1 Tax=Sideroxyarcus emersonii TaxID=2764705 RepID=A0AAN2C0N6_9PROT|nr:hypothetical protein [Sideroxyarcus emersonii]BCK88837.1 hypothetical protein MIZ01_2643 [Sideroxyarcus emersonii]